MTHILALSRLNLALLVQLCQMCIDVCLYITLVNINILKYYLTQKNLIL